MAPASDAGLDIPLSSNDLTAQDVPTDEPDEIRAIWGTTVSLRETMKLFRDFIQNFKVKYRVAFDRANGQPTRPFTSPEDGEVTLYESYIRRMRQTGVTNLNLDATNLLAYPPSKKLHTYLLKYPQEVVPSMDQVLKDMMLETAEHDQQIGMEGMVGSEGDQEISTIMTSIYKVRPFGIAAANMRELNPMGAFTVVVAVPCFLSHTCF